MNAHHSKKTSGITSAFVEALKEVFTRSKAFMVGTTSAVAGAGWTIQMAGHLLSKDPRMLTIGHALVEAGHLIAEGGGAATSFVIADAGKSALETYNKKTRKKATSSKKKNQNHRQRTPTVVVKQVIIQQPANTEQITPVIEHAVINPQITAPATKQPVIDKPVTAKNLGWSSHQHRKDAPPARSKTQRALSPSRRATVRKTNG